MSQLLPDHAAVVTGGASGIGRSIAKTFAAHGADIVVADVREDPREGGRPTHEVISRETDADATFVSCDVTDTDALDAAVTAADAFGGIDVMVNNAGVFRADGFLETTEDQYQTVMDVNAKGVFFGGQAAARKMTTNGGGCILNVSSVAGMEGGGGYVAYSASKGAVRLMTYAMAEALGPDIRVNAIHPGATETQIMAGHVDFFGTDAADRHARSLPAHRLGAPQDIANAAVLLASDLAGYVTGASLLVDGGDVNTRGLLD